MRERREDWITLESGFSMYINKMQQILYSIFNCVIFVTKHLYDIIIIQICVPTTNHGGQEIKSFY